MFKSITKSLKGLFGTKQDKDIALYQPFVDEVNEAYAGLTSLSNDELRNQTLVFKERIKEFLSEIDEDIANLKKDAEQEIDILQKEEIFKKIDELTEERDKLLEEVLLEIRPKAFAVVKETARRFTENESLEVTVTEFDRELKAAQDAKSPKDYISIEGDKANYRTS